MKNDEHLCIHFFPYLTYQQQQCCVYIILNFLLNSILVSTNAQPYEIVNGTTDVKPTPEDMKMDDGRMYIRMRRCGVCGIAMH